MSKCSLSDIVIAGAGIIGLSLGMELRLRGLSVVVLERERRMRSASWAAGGMLAASRSGKPFRGAASFSAQSRNGILLAPVTARVLAQAIFGESPEVALDAFSPMRLQ